MCYAYKPHRSNDFAYAKDFVYVIVAGSEVRRMRWDLIPRGFMRQEGLNREEALKAKDSRKKDSRGFSSYNARIETVDSLWAFRDAWREGKRGLIPAEAWKERPNMDDAPRAFKGREYEIALEQPHYMAALFDVWRSRDGEVVESCTVITGPSDKVPAIRDIWHERMPILLAKEAARAWIDPATSPEAAKALLLEAAIPPLAVREILPEARQEELL